ncbi:MAG: endo-polygalacturonase [Bacteroidales bacterium]|nr:endo-polygalacturonase [Bacteroidales bacterium]
MKKLIVCALCVFVLELGLMAQDVLQVYSAPEGVEMKDDFTVKVRLAGGEWQDVPTYMVKVDEVRQTKHCVEKASLGYFDFEGQVEVSVTYNKGPIETAKVRPLSYGIKPVVDGSTLTFTLDCPRNLSVEVNGDIFHNLHLFANAIDVNNPIDGVIIKNEKQLAKKRKDVIYFGPGLHRIDTLFPVSGQTVYIAGGAVVRGTIHVVNASDVKIYGRGIVHPSGRGEGVYIQRSKNVEVDGIISTQCPVGGSDGVKITNVKVISSYGWGDGLNVFASSNVHYDRCFARTSDDCVTVYATRKGFTGSCRNILTENCVLWADVAHPIMIGIHGNVESPDVIENLVYRNIDILDHKEKQIDYQGCMAINAGDDNLIRNILFEDIRIEDFRQGQLVNIRIFYNKKYCLAPGRGIEDITFRNVTYNGSGEEMSVIYGYSEERKVKNIRFENLVINGQVISDDMPGKPAWYKTGDMCRFLVGEHVENIQFVK